VFATRAAPGEPDQTYLSDAAGSQRVAVHVVHDRLIWWSSLLFGISDGQWAETGCRGSRRVRPGGHGTGSSPSEKGPSRLRGPRPVALDRWLSPGHRQAKTVTNAVTSRFGDGPETAAGVLARLARSAHDGARKFTAGLDDSIGLAIRGVHETERHGSSGRREPPFG
jgi:hypothetical protein